jgi:protein O-GlcNAc transferase
MNAMLMQDALRLRRAGKLKEAAEIHLGILQGEPNHFGALYGLGALRYQSGQFEDAERLIGEALQVDPKSPNAHYNRACLLQRLNRPEEALPSFDTAIALKPDYVEALVDRGILLGQSNRHAEAFASLDRAVAINPNIAEIWSCRAIALIGLLRSEDALASVDHALALSPYAPGAWKNRGVVLSALSRTDDALACFDKAVELAPDEASLLLCRADLLLQRERYHDAVAAYKRYLAIVPGDARAWRSRSLALQELRHKGDAMACLSKALVFSPDDSGTLVERALLHFDSGRFVEAAEDLQKVLERDPDCPCYVSGYLAMCKLNGCDWRSLREDRARIIAEIRAGNLPIEPFDCLAIGVSASETLAAVRIWMAGEVSPQTKPLWRGERYAHGRIRLAYLSADFNNHVVARMIAGVFEHHDKARFETMGISFGRDDGSAMRTRIKSAFERFVDVCGKTDSEAAAILREMEPDIAVDLTGLTRGCRPGILARRPAPVQVNYLGYAGTMGAECIDYILADRIVIPEEERCCYSEQVVYLPNSYLPNDSTRAIASQTLSREQAGLPPSGVVFCCFNNSYKLSPEMFEIWMRLLNRVEGSVLWLGQAALTGAQNLKREAQARGVAPERLLFAPYARTGAEHLARLALADFMLDTLPYNGHATACDALWAGLPIVTCRGSSFPGRVAASALMALGLPELVTDSLEAYEALALKLARDKAALSAVKAKLAKNRLTHPLFDTAGITRDLEAAYSEMWQRRQRNEAPAPIALSKRGDVIHEIAGSEI